MTRWLLNSAVIVAGGYGTYEYAPMHREAAAQWLMAGPFKSRVGYPETAQYIETLAPVRVPISREVSALRPGDEALVVRLQYRVDPILKGKPLPPTAWEIGLLRRLS